MSPFNWENPAHSALCLDKTRNILSTVSLTTQARRSFSNSSYETVPLFALASSSAQAFRSRASLGLCAEPDECCHCPTITSEQVRRAGDRWQRPPHHLRSQDSRGNGTNKGHFNKSNPGTYTTTHSRCHAYSETSTDDAATPNATTATRWRTAILGICHLWRWYWGEQYRYRSGARK